MANHADLTGAELHENKGAAAASDNTVATAVSGATVWRKIKKNSLDTTEFFGTNEFVFTTILADVSTASKAYIAFPFACTVESVTTVLEGAITVADSTVTCRNHSGGSMGTLTIAYSGSAAGDVDSLTPASNKTFASGERMTIETDGASTDTQKLFVTVRVARTA